jgi:hypothetical protein
VEPVVTDRTDVIAVAPDRLWGVLADVDDYPSFWPWLRSFDGRALETGTVWRGVIDVAGPLRLEVAIHIDEVVVERCVRAHLAGDLSGPARLDVTPDDRGSALHLTAALVPERADLRALTRWTRPIAQASHDRVIARAVSHLATHVER